MTASDPPFTSSVPAIPVVNPVTGGVIGMVTDHDADAVRAAVGRARIAQPAWAALGARRRAALLTRWSRAIWERKDALMALIRAETGKTEASAYSEVGIIDNTTAYYAARAPRWLRSERRKTLLPVLFGAQAHYLPYGVVGVITPWNYPYMNLLVDAIPALLAGNSVVIKPSDLTPLTARFAVDLMHESGIPADVVQIVTGRGDTGRALVDAVDYVAFTGSTATGRAIAMRCAERLIPCTLELGGKDAMIVLADADLDHAARCAVRGGLENAGQACVGIERIYVESAVYDLFVSKLCALVEALTVSGSGGYDVAMGSMTCAREVDRVESQMADALARGARLLTGGARLEGHGAYFYAPTVLVDVDHTMRVMRDETFGPILPVMRVADAAEAVRLANDSPYGLSGAVFSRDEGRARRVARQLQAGDVSVNGTQLFFTAAGATMGGFKTSGLGRRGGIDGFRRFTQVQSVITDRVPIPNLEMVQASSLTRRVYAMVRAARRVWPGA